MGFIDFIKSVFFGYNNRRGARIAKAFLDLKVKNPLNSSETCALGDILLSVDISEECVLKTARRLGIGFSTATLKSSGGNVLDRILWTGGRTVNYTHPDGGVKPWTWTMKSPSPSFSAGKACPRLP